MAVNKIPEVINDMRAYIDGADDLIGVNEVELPDLKSLTEDIEGIGVAGKIEAPIAGHFDSLELKMTWQVPTKTRDHPRSCGKDSYPVDGPCGSQGSPPLVRERPVPGPRFCVSLGITPARAGKTVMDSFICAISLLPVFKIYLISLQNICPPKNIKHVSPKYSYHNPLFKEASHYVYSIIKSVL